jgi:hypothetical protein
MAVRLFHVLLKLATTGNREHLHSSANRKKWSGRINRPTSHRQIECILLGVDVVHVLALELGAVTAGIKISTPREQYSVCERETLGNLVNRHHSIGCPGLNRQGFTASTKHSLAQGPSRDNRPVSERRRLSREAAWNDDQWTLWHA